jgi:hypothetical protein
VTDNSAENHLVGYAWLVAQTGVSTVNPLRSVSVIGRSRKSEPGKETFPKQYAPAGGDRALQEHFRFALAHEGVHLEMMARLFDKLGHHFIVDWLRAEPTSSYARRLGFFYEWLTGRKIAEHDRVASGNYVDALDAGKYLAATVDEQNRRWRINDNLPGTRDFCPLIRLDGEIRQKASIPFDQEVDGLIEQFGEDMIMRSVSWLSVKESRASFQIEREADKEDRIHRFARALAMHCGRQEDPLSMESLKMLQDAILGDAKTTFQRGLRRSPIFVGHSERLEQVVDYLAPHHDQVPGMLEGLRVFAQRTAPLPVSEEAARHEGRDWMPTVLRATVLSFGFVYIHPMADGNGRISRFLINDTLRRDGAVPKPLILPVSAIISANARERARYDQTLELVSSPLMDRLRGKYGFEREEITTFEDGVRSNFRFDGWDEAAPAWRYLDLSQHASYLGGIVRRSLGEGIGNEARFLQRFDRARGSLAKLIEARDEDMDRIIRGISEHHGASKTLRKLYPELLGDEDSAAAIEKAVLEAFAADGEGREDASGVTRQRG